MTGRVRPAAQGPLEIQTLPAMTAMRHSCFCSIPCELPESSYMELKGHFFSWNACEASRQDSGLISWSLPMEVSFHNASTNMGSNLYAAALLNAAALQPVSRSH